MEQTDITPELQAKIESVFKDLVQRDRVLSSIRKKASEGKANYADAQEYAGALSKCLQKAYSTTLSGEILPDGILYYNIANRLIPPYLNSLYSQISEVCQDVQQGLNEKARIGIKPIQAGLNQDRIDGIVNRISSEPFEDVKWLLGAPVDNFARSVVDDHVEANADFHYKSGMKPKIIRKTDGKCCKWCTAHAGTFDYSPSMDREVFRRHENCGCTVEYDPADGSRRRQNVYEKNWNNEAVSVSKMPWKLDYYRIKNDEERKRLITECVEQEKAIFVEPQEILSKNIKNVSPKEGFYDVCCHGGPYSVKLNGKVADAETLCAIIAQRPDYKKGQPIRLLSCSTGKRDDGIAQYIADKLQTTVVAPSDTLWVYPSGKMTIGPEPRADSGEWKTFTPKKKGKTS